MTVAGLRPARVPDGPAFRLVLIVLVAACGGQPALGQSAAPGRQSSIRHTAGGQPLPRDLKFSHLTTKDGLTQDNIVGTLQDHRGFMWFATNGGGLHRYDGNTFVVYQNSPDDPNTLSANSTQSLLEDDHGDLWIGTWGGGLDKFDPTTERFTHYRYSPDNPNSISGDRVKTLARESRGYLCITSICKQNSSIIAFNTMRRTRTASATIRLIQSIGIGPACYG